MPPLVISPDTVFDCQSGSGLPKSPSCPWAWGCHRDCALGSHEGPYGSDIAFG